LHPSTDGPGELALRSINCSGCGDANQRRIGARVGGGSPAAGEQCGYGEGSG